MSGRSQDCVRTPAALAQSGLMCCELSYTPLLKGGTELQSVLPDPDATFCPDRMKWIACKRSEDPLHTPACWSGMATDIIDQGPIWYTEWRDPWLLHKNIKDLADRVVWKTREYDAALPMELWTAFKTSRERAPAPGHTPDSELARALSLLVRILGNALHGEKRPVPLDSKTFAQSLGWDPSLKAIMDHLGWHLAPLDEDMHRSALHPPSDTASCWPVYVELATWCAHLNGTPAAPEGMTWQIQPFISPLVPSNVARPDERIHFASARLGVSTEESAKRICDMYRLNSSCFPSRHQELFLALEYVEDVRHLGEPITTLMVMEQSQGMCTYKDVRASYERLGISTPVVAPGCVSLWDEMPPPPPMAPDEVLGAYNRAVHEALLHGTDEELRSARRALRVLARYHSPAPELDERERANPVQDPQDAYQLLQTSPDIDDGLVLMGYEVYVNEAKSRAELLRMALEAIADARQSDYLHRFLRGEQESGSPVSLPRGLYNIGNTCYLNSLLQYLDWIRPVREAVKMACESASRNIASAQQERALTFAQLLDALFSTMASSNEPALFPSKELAYLALVPLVWEQAYDCTKDELMRQVTTQQDVCECLDNIVSLLDTACASEATQTPVRRLFSGASLQKLDPAPKDSSGTDGTKQTFTSIPVTILPGTRDVYDALDTFFNEEFVFLGNDAKVRREITLQEAPILLQIHVQRVQYDRTAQKIVKNQAALDLPDTLFLDRYMDLSLSKSERRPTLTLLHTRSQELRREKTKCTDRIQLLENEHLTGLERAANALGSLQNTTLDDDELHLLLQEHSPEELMREASDMRAEVHQLRMQADTLRTELQGVWADERHVPYQLASVCMHRGEATHGHYFVNQRDFAKNEWISFNDTNVSTITGNEVSREYVIVIISWLTPVPPALHPISWCMCAKICNPHNIYCQTLVQRRLSHAHTEPYGPCRRASTCTESCVWSCQSMYPVYVLNLTAHGYHKERNKVEHQNRPEHWNIKHTEHSCAERD